MLKTLQTTDPKIARVLKLGVKTKEISAVPLVKSSD